MCQLVKPNSTHSANEWHDDLSNWERCGWNIWCERRMTIANLMAKLKGANEILTCDRWSIECHLRSMSELEHLMKDKKKWTETGYWNHLSSFTNQFSFIHHFRTTFITFDWKKQKNNRKIECLQSNPRRHGLFIPAKIKQKIKWIVQGIEFGTNTRSKQIQVANRKLIHESIGISNIPHVS